MPSLLAAALILLGCSGIPFPDGEHETTPIHAMMLYRSGLAVDVAHLEAVATWASERWAERGHDLASQLPGLVVELTAEDLRLSDGTDATGLAWAATGDFEPVLLVQIEYDGRTWHDHRWVHELGHVALATDTPRAEHHDLIYAFIAEEGLP